MYSVLPPVEELDVDKEVIGRELVKITFILNETMKHMRNELLTQYPSVW